MKPSKRSHMALAAGAILTLAITGCAENRYCAKPQAYETAPSVPDIQSVGDIKVTPAPDAYVIPPAPANPMPFGVKVATAKETRWLCLDMPPPFVPAAAQATSTSTAPPKQ